MSYLKKLLKKIFYIQKPNSLPMDFFSEAGDYTWEKWKQDAKKQHPIKYFFSETVPHIWAVRVSMPLDHLWYWFVSHTIRRYHFLDLRQPKTNDIMCYRWGWIDEDHQLLYACFNILVSHVEVRNSSKFHYHATPEGIAKLRARDEGDDWDPTKQADALQEIYELHKYWTVDREIKSKEHDVALKDWHDHRAEDKASGDETRWNKLRKIEEDFDQEEDDMLMRILKIRRYLWT